MLCICHVAFNFSGKLAVALRQEQLFLSVILLGIAGFFWSSSPSNTIGMIRVAVLSFGAYLYFRQRFTPDYVFRLFMDVLGIILVLSVLAAVFTPLGAMSGYDTGRWRGLFGHKNSLGEYSGLTILVLFAFWHCGLRLYKRHIVYAISAVLCIVMAGSATSVGVLAFTIGVLTLTKSFSKAHVTKGLLVSSYLLSILLGIAAAYILIPYVAGLLDRDLTFTGRTDIWAWFLYFGNQRPFTGWGWATIGANETILGFIRETLKLPYIQTPHNAYISIIVEIGYPALILYLLWLLSTFVGSSIRALFHKSPTEIIRVSIVAGLMVHNFFESTAGAIPSLWLFLLVATGPTFAQKRQGRISFLRNRGKALAYRWRCLRKGRLVLATNSCLEAIPRSP